LRSEIASIARLLRTQSPECTGERKAPTYIIRGVRCLPLLKATAPDERHPKRVTVAGTPHMLRHSYATALIQSGENAKTVQNLMGHHGVAFTMDEYADAWPEALSNAREKVDPAVPTDVPAECQTRQRVSVSAAGRRARQAARAGPG